MSELITISRNLWAGVLEALDTRDPDACRSAFHRLLAIAPSAWDDSVSDDPSSWSNEQPRIAPTG